MMAPAAAGEIAEIVVRAGTAFEQDLAAGVRQSFVVEQHHAAAGGVRRALVTEADDRHHAEAAGGVVADRRTEAFHGVLDERDLVLAGDRGDRLECGRVEPGRCHDDRPRAVVDRCLHAGRVVPAGARLRIDESRTPTRAADAGDQASRAVCRTHDFVAEPESDGEHRGLDRDARGRRRHGVGTPRDPGGGLFQLQDRTTLAAGVRGQRRLERLVFTRTDVGTIERDGVHEPVAFNQRCIVQGLRSVGSTSFSLPSIAR
jgi:hypothetical protein